MAQGSGFRRETCGSEHEGLLDNHFRDNMSGSPALPDRPLRAKLGDGQSRRQPRRAAHTALAANQTQAARMMVAPVAVPIQG